jgi:glycosyltransferase involved in cell wall biosynthesis
MRLLVINYEMDQLSPTVAWTCRVVDLLAESCEQVVVLTGHHGEYVPPRNVFLESIPRWPYGVPHRLGGKWLYNLRVFQLARRFEIEACFVHMASDWLRVLWPSLRMLGIPTLLWYAHGTVTPELHHALRAATRVVTSSPEGFRIASEKVRVIGQGVDTELFAPADPRPESPADVVTVARISPRKRIDRLLDVARELKAREEAVGIRVRLVGTAITLEDRGYENRLRATVWDEGLQDIFHFEGFVPQRHIPNYYRNAFVHLDFSETGSMDKAVLEALASGCPVLTSNGAFAGLLKDYPSFLVEEPEPDAVARRIVKMRQEYPGCNREALRSLIVGRHDIHSYSEALVQNLREMQKHHPSSSR